MGLKDNKITIIKLNEIIRRRNEEKIRDYDLEEILKECNISLDDFDNCFDSIDYTREKKIEKEEMYRIKYKDSLGKYCEKNKYYYPLVYRLIKKSQEKHIPLVDIVKNYKQNGRKILIDIIGMPDELLLERQLRYLGLCHGYIHVNIMFYKDTPEEAIMNEVFRLNIKKEYSYLEPIYDYYVENKIMSINSNYNFDILEIEKELSKEERKIIEDLVNKCSEKLEKYKYLRVGLEKDIEKSKKLIKKYNFDRKDIIKSVIYSFHFDLTTKQNIKKIDFESLWIILSNFNKLNEKELTKLKEQLGQKEYNLIETYNKKLELEMQYKNS